VMSQNAKTGRSATRGSKASVEGQTQPLCVGERTRYEAARPINADIDAMADWHLKELRASLEKRGWLGCSAIHDG